MRHAILTCKNHPNLRWSCKEIAVNSNGSYNGMRNIFFSGIPSGQGMYEDGSGLHCLPYTVRPDGGYEAIKECDCPPSELTWAPEDKLVKRD